MVVSKGIALTLHSPESLNVLTPNALEEFLLSECGSHVGEPDESLAIRYVPVLLGSSFWLSYRILVPPPPGMATKLYVFKLFVGRVHFTTWSVDGDAEKPQKRWKGRCMFGLFEDPAMIDHTNAGRRAFQKRAFAFTPPPARRKHSTRQAQGHRKQDSRDSEVDGTERRKLQKKRRSEEYTHPFTPPKSWAKKSATDANDERFIEVRVFRASGKRRVPRNVPRFDSSSFELNGGGGLDFKHAGYATRPHPRRYYEFDLIDPKDMPYVRFKFYYRTMEELKALGIALGGESTPASTPSSVDTQATMTPTSAKETFSSRTSNMSLKQKLEQARSAQPPKATLGDIRDKPRPSTPMAPSRAEPTSDLDDEGSPRLDFRRLSMPPSIKLLPSFGSWRKSMLLNSASAKGDTALKEDKAPTVRHKSSVDNLEKRRGQSLWRAFHEEREAEHGGY